MKDLVSEMAHGIQGSRPHVSRGSYRSPTWTIVDCEPSYTCLFGARIDLDGLEEKRQLVRRNAELIA